MKYTMKSMIMTPDFEKRLAKVNGVVVPSKIPPGGQVHRKGPQRANRHSRRKKSRMTCIICDSDCLDLRGLRNHFVPCVDRNGNPTGARWDDGLICAAAPVGPSSTQMSGPQDHLSEDLKTGDYVHNNIEEHVAASESLPSDNFDNLDPRLVFAPLDNLRLFDLDFQQIDPQLSSPISNGAHSHNSQLHNLDPQLAGPVPTSMQPLDPQLNNLDPQQSHPPPDGPEPYNPHLRIDVQTNEILLSMLQDWQNIIHDGGEQYTLAHPRFHQLMNELVERDLMSDEWTWTVDVEEFDMDWTRVAVEGLQY